MATERNGASRAPFDRCGWQGEGQKIRRVLMSVRECVCPLNI